MKKFICISITIMFLMTPFSVSAQPVSQDILFSITKNQSITFSQQDFIDKFTSDIALASVKLSSIPDTAVGSLLLSGTIVTENMEIPTNQLGGLIFTPTNNYTGTVQMNWQGSDGTAYSETPAKITITIADTPEEPIPVIYDDMAGHWGEYTSVQLFSENLWVGEKIGEKRYFRPDVKINRIDFILTLLSSMGKNFDVLESADLIFEEENFELHPSVAQPAKWAYQKGIINGSLENGKLFLHPYTNITRAEAAKIIGNALKLTVPPESQNEDFADQSSIPEWAVDAIRSLHGYNIIKGYDDKTFRPLDNITRIQAGEMIWQVYTLVNSQPETDKTEPTPTP